MLNYESVKVRISICKRYHYHSQKPAGTSAPTAGAVLLTGQSNDGRSPPTNPAEAVTVVVSIPFDVEWANDFSAYSICLT